MENKNRNVFVFWHKIESLEDAIDTTKAGMAAAIMCAAITGLMALASMLGVKVFPGFSAFALVDAVIFAGFGWGLYRHSRLCAVLVLLFYLLEQANNIANFQTYNAVMALMFISFFIQGVRGTFKYHKFKAAPSTTNVSDA